jgi:drug/metabolite transporter (DMT)-like permease
MPCLAVSSRAYVLLSITTLIWAGNSIAGKIGAGHVHPVLLTSLRWLLATLIIIPLAWPNLKRDWPVIKRHRLLLIVYGMFGFGLFNLLLYTALNHASVVNVMIEQAAIPLMIFLGNFALFRVKATIAQLAGFGLTLAGVIVTASHGDPTRLLRLEVNIGDALMLLSVIIYAGYTVALKWKPPVHWQTLVAIPCMGAVLACVPFLIWTYSREPFAWPDATGWGVIVYATIFASLVATATYVAGIELIGANRAGVFINLLPVFGVLLSVVILRAPLEGFHFVAMALVIAGIVLSEWSRARFSSPSPH